MFDLDQGHLVIDTKGEGAYQYLTGVLSPTNLGKSVPELLQPHANYIRQPTPDNLRCISCTVEVLQTPRRNVPSPLATTRTRATPATPGGDHQSCLDGVQLVDDFQPN